MPGMFAGKSLVFLVTRMRPRSCAEAKMIASGDLSRGRSRRRAAARRAISGSNSSISNPDRNRSIPASMCGDPFDITSIHAMRLIHARVNGEVARSISLRASSTPPSASINMFASNAKPLIRVAWLEASCPRPYRDRSGAAGRPPHRNYRAIRRAPLRNRRPSIASTPRAATARIRADRT